MTERVRAIVIGGGVVGSAVLRELTRRGIHGAVLVEAGADVGEGASKSNSGIVHTGFDAKPGTLEARLLARSRRLWPTSLEELAVPLLRIGALMLARTDEEAARLGAEVAAAADANGVPTELLSRAALRDVAPYVTEDALAALSIPDESVVDPFWLTRAYAESAMAGGAEVRLCSSIVGLAVGDDGVVATLNDGSVLEADLAFDCAGLQADEVAALAGDRSFSITPRKGQFLVLEESLAVERIVLPIPGRMGKGMLVTPIVFGGLLLGPTAVEQTDKDDRSTDPAETARIRAACQALVPTIASVVPLRAFAGLRTVGSTGDYIIRPSAVGSRLWLVAGIRSTGVSASPAIAELAVGDALAHHHWPFVASPLVFRPPEMAFPEDPGEVVCLCRGISRGEIDAACARPIAPRTIDALKRRGGAAFGDCQGARCAVEIAGILAEMRGLSIEEIEQSRPGSWLFAGRYKASGADASVPMPADVIESDASYDVIVIGAGRAGAAATRVLSERGVQTASLEYRRGTTAVGLSPVGGGWQVLVQGRSGPLELACRAVFLASGGYAEPLGGRPVGGTRPAGVVTVEFVEAALERGLAPGLRCVIVGTGPTANGIAEHLIAAGIEVVARLDAPPTVLRGEARLAGILANGRWIACDTLVLADARLPLSQLLRPLGLVEPGPGRPVPCDADGRLGPVGLWAAGCCVLPDVDHRGCADHGAHVAGLVAAALRRTTVR